MNQPTEPNRALYERLNKISPIGIISGAELLNSNASAICKPAFDDTKNIESSIVGKSTPPLRAVEIKPNTPEFKSFMQLLAESFPIADEVPPEQAFIDAARNHSSDHIRNNYTRAAYKMIGLQDPQSGKILSASSFATFVTDDATPVAKEIDGTAMIVFAVTHPDCKNMGLGTRIVALAENTAREYVAQEKSLKSIADARVTFFAEVNHPAKMTADQYISDTESAGIDQIDRQAFWKKRGYGIIQGFNYVQPSLGEGFEPCRNLSLHTKQSSDKLSANILRFHLTNWVGVTLHEGDKQTTENDPEWKSMKENLQSQEHFLVNYTTKSEQEDERKKFARIQLASETLRPTST